MSTNGKVENGFSFSSMGPSEEIVRRAVHKSPHESWCHVESNSEQSPEYRSQRRHYKDMNRSSVFDFTQSPAEEIKIIEQQQQQNTDQDQHEEINMKHKQKRHYENKNQTSFDG